MICITTQQILKTLIVSPMHRYGYVYVIDIQFAAPIISLKHYRCYSGIYFCLSIYE